MDPQTIKCKILTPRQDLPYNATPSQSYFKKMTTSNKTKNVFEYAVSVIYKDITFSQDLHLIGFVNMPKVRLNFQGNFSKSEKLSGFLGKANKIAFNQMTKPLVRNSCKHSCNKHEFR